MIEVLERKGRIDSLDALSEPGGVAEGEIGELPLADLLESILLQRRSGHLSLVREAEGGGPEQGILVIREGEVIQARVGSVDGEKALFRILAWRTGSFTFEVGVSDEAPVILAPTRRLLVEGLRQLEEWDRLSLRLPPLDSPLKLTVKNSELPNIVHPLTQEVLLLLEIYTTVREVVDHSAFPDYQVLRTLHTLAERGIVQMGRAPVPAPAAADVGERIFSEAQSRRLRDWLTDGRGAAGEGPLTAKLLVVSSRPEVTPSFVRLLERVPGVELDHDPDQSAGRATRLAPMGRLPVGDDVEIELVHLPADERWEPFWPLAGHGALGTLFLLDGPVGESARRVERVSQALGRLPRARTFHVVLLGKDERIAPEELRENLALIDEASLFLMPMQSAKQPDALLRSLLARVMP